MQGADILLVEDDETLRTIVQRNLQVRGYCIRCAADVQTALQALRAHRFDLILLDINLPDRTGWDVLRCALAEHLLSTVSVFSNQEQAIDVLPVVILSAVQVSLQRLAEFHVLAYLPKPFPMDAVLRLAAEAAERHERQPQIQVDRSNHLLGEECRDA